MLEIFSHRFYKYLDDSTQCADMAENDVIVCYELPCHARNGRHSKRQPDDPFILPVFLCDLHPPRLSFGRGANLFGYPTIVVVDKDQATDVDAIYDAVIDRLQRWTDNCRDLYTWEAASPPSLDETPIPESPSTQSGVDEGHECDVEPVNVAEGEVLKDEEDDKPMDQTPDQTTDGYLSKVGTKKDIFNLRLQGGHKDYGTSLPGYGSATQRYTSWELRGDMAHSTGTLLREHDALFCEFDENVKAYYFGDIHTRWEHARWNTWSQFIHPEYEASLQAATEKKHKGISIQDCLDEFTKVRTDHSC